MYIPMLFGAAVIAYLGDLWIERCRRAKNTDGAKAPNAPNAPNRSPTSVIAPEVTRDPPYQTRPEDVVAPTAWARVNGATMTTEPLRDRATGGYAHLSYQGALAAAEKYGARLPTREEVTALSDAARAAGLELDPVILPDPAMLRAAGAPLDRPTSGIAEAAQKTADVNRIAQALRTARMTGRPWAEAHDARVRAQLMTRGWDGTKPVANAGKLWIAGAPPGRAYLMGWRGKDGVFIQQGATSGPGPHDAAHHDYGTLVVLVKKT